MSGGHGKSVRKPRECHLNTQLSKIWEGLEEIHTTSNNLKVVFQKTFKMIEAQQEHITLGEFSSP